MLLGMDADNDTSISGREARVNAEFQKRQTQLFTRFALAEASVLALAVLAIFVLKLVEPETGVLILLGIAVLSGMVLTGLLMRTIKAKQQALAQARGGAGSIW